LTGCQSSPAPAAQANILDTHTHFYDPSRPQGVPWPPREDAILYRRVLPSEFERLADSLGVVGTVVVEASAWEEDNQWVLDLAKKEPVILGLVGHLKPGRPGFRKYLERFGRDRRFRGIRTGLWDVKIEPGNSVFIQDLQLLAERGLALDVLVGPEQLGLVSELAAKVPGLPMVIDHCANVRVDGRTPPEFWIEGIRAVARHSNVLMKVSGLVEGTGRTDGQAPGDTDYYRPVLDVIWDAFGQERLIFGSNWPVSARFAAYATVLQIVRSYFSARGTEARDRYFRRNAERIYGVSKTFSR
jgi:L-fuconolactonase